MQEHEWIHLHSLESAQSRLAAQVHTVAGGPVVL